MLPNYHYYMQAHHYTMLTPIYIASIVLSLCFINNYNELSFWLLFMGNFAIFIVILLSAMMNERIYWRYCIFSEKFYLKNNNKSEIKRTIISRYFTVFSLSYIIGVIIIFLVTSYLIEIVFDSQIYIIIFLGFFLSPLMIWFFMYFLIKFYVSCSIHYLNNFSLYSREKKKFNISYLIVNEVFLSLLVNFPIVFPLQNSAAFSLEQGYLNIEFIVALIILLYSVLFVMLFLSKASKINYLMGMIICYSFEEDFAEVKKRGLFCRVLWFLIFIPLGTLLLCLLFYLLNIKENFFLIYSVSLSLVIYLYFIERRNKLYQEFILAFDMILRLKALKNFKE